MHRIVSLCAVAFAACVFRGGGQGDPALQSSNPYDIALPDGYRIEVVTERLDFPSGITFDENGTPYVIEAEPVTGPIALNEDQLIGQRVFFQKCNDESEISHDELGSLLDCLHVVEKADPKE